MYKVTGYQNETTMIVKPISYSSKSLLTAQINNDDSTVKTIIDNWYKNNMTDYKSKLSDEIFCNDRSLSSGSGYLVSSITSYGAFNRLYDNKKPTFSCTQDNDKFSLSNTSTKLDYPVSLIKVAMAGGLSYYNGNYSPNDKYYLYNGQNF